MAEPVRHRQTKGAATDMFDLQPPRHISTLREAAVCINQHFWEILLPLPDQGVMVPVDMTRTHPQNRRLGYARVSTYGQTLESQLEQLRGAGCTRIYREKVTGAHSNRRQLL